MPSSPESDAFASTAGHLLAGKYFQMAAFVMLVYDHLLTIDEEINRIWKQKFSGATLLFFINRYITPLQFIIILHAFNDPSWTEKVCDNYVVFEGASTTFLVAICQLIMILRVYALYRRSLAVIVFLMILWAVQIAVSAIGLRTGYREPLPPQLTGCILTGHSPIFPSLWVAPLVTDSFIFVLTLFRTRKYIRNSGRTPTMHIFIRDGTLYFLAIFLANLMNTLFFFLAPLDLKAVGASFSQLITNVMISRLVLNLRSLSTEHYSGSSGHNLMRRGVVDQSFLTRTIGNLGEDMIDSGYYSQSDAQEKEREIPLVNISKRFDFSRNI